jgi:ferritin-like metal-binding protein YciE
LSTLRAGADNVDDPELASASRQHLVKTEEHERLVKQRLDALDAGPSMLKEVAQNQVAERAGDQETVRVADQILTQERAAAEKLSDLLERVADHDLRQMGLAA